MKHFTTLLIGSVLFAFILTFFSCKKKAFSPPGPIVASKKRALLIGVEHTNAKPPPGQSFSPYATDDAKANVEHVQRLLDFKGFRQYEVKKLISKSATAQAIIKEINFAATELRNGGLFVFYFMGHGLQVDGSDDYFPSIPEADNRDEAIVAFDSLIIDNRLYHAFSKFNSKVEVVMLFDCCNAGSFYALNFPECKPEICFPLDRSEIAYYKQQFNQNYKVLQSCPNSLMRNINGYDCKVLYLGSSFDTTTTDGPKIAPLIRQTWDSSDRLLSTYCGFINKFLDRYTAKVVVETSNNVDYRFLYKNLFLE